MNHFGVAFKIARQAKGLTQVDVAKDILSVASLSKFESGKSMVGADKLHDLLQRLNITYLEFFDIFVDLQNKSQFHFFSELSYAISAKNDYSLNDLKKIELEQYEKSKNIRHIHNAHLIECYLSKLLSKELPDVYPRNLYNYLFETPEWGYYEIILFSYTVEFFAVKQALNLIREVLRKSNLLESIPHVKIDLINTLLNVCTLLIRETNYNEAFTTLRDCKKILKTAPYINEMNRFRFTEGILLYLNGNHSGLAQCYEAINLCGEFQLYDRAESMSQLLKEFTGDTQMKCKDN